MATPPDPHPFIAALPPETDYITYLTLLEYNLNRTNISVLQNVLEADAQKAEPALIINIGWDLVALLLPLLPASRECLLLIARYGNPREVVLKVAEAFENVAWDDEGTSQADAGDDEDEEHEDAKNEGTIHPALRPEATSPPIFKSESESKDESNDTDNPQPIHPALRAEAPPTTTTTVPTSEDKTPLPLPLTQLTTLTTMLSTIHPRIRTTKPSRFAATTLSSVLSAFSKAPTQQMPSLIPVLTQLAEAMDAKAPPKLPPRNPPLPLVSAEITNAASSDQGVVNAAPKAADPEADAPSSSAATADAPIHRRLLLCFVTHLTRVYVDALGELADADEVPGCVWAPRELEAFQPGLNVPGRKTWGERCVDEVGLVGRLGALGMLMGSVRALGVGWEGLVGGAGGLGGDGDGDGEDEIGLARQRFEKEERESEYGDDDRGGRDEHGDEWYWNEDVLPSRSEDIRLSPLGCLTLLAAWQSNPPASAASSTSTPTSIPTSIAIFPQHACILDRHITQLSSPLNNPAHLDALLALGIRALSSDTITSESSHLPSTAQASTYLRHTATLSATASSPALRFAAHTLTTTVLRSHPSDALRLAFIRSVLEESPFPNLRVSAVGWLKGCFVDGNADLFGGNGAAAVEKGRREGDEQQRSGEDVDEGHEDKALFSTALPLTLLGPVLFDTVGVTAYFGARPASVTEKADLVETSRARAQYDAFSSTIPYHLSVLNMYYFLLRAPEKLRQRLDLQEVHTEAKVGKYLDSLKAATCVFGPALSASASSEGLDHASELSGNGSRDVAVEGMAKPTGEGLDSARAELLVLADRTERVQESLVAVGL